MEPARLSPDQSLSNLLVRSCPAKRIACQLLFIPKELRPPSMVVGQGASNVFAMPPTVAAPALPVVHKIAVLAQHLGPQRAYALMEREAPRPDLKEPSEEDLQKIEALSQEVKELTGGVVTSYQLNGFRTLRMLLLAALSRCIKRQQNIQIETTSGPVSGSKFLAVQLKLLDYLLSVDILDDSLEEMKKTKTTFDEFLEAMDSYKEVIFPVEERPLVQQDILLIIKIVELLRQTVEAPYFYLPHLLTHIASSPLYLDQIAQDLQNINPRAERWVNDFVDALNMTSDSFFSFLEKEDEKRPQKVRKKEEIKALRSQFELVQKEVGKLTQLLLRDLREWHQFERLPTSLQKNNLDTLKKLHANFENLKEKLLKIQTQYASYFHLAKSFLDSFFAQPKNQRDTMNHYMLLHAHDSRIDDIYNHTSALITALAGALEVSSSKYLCFYQDLSRLLQTPFKMLDHISLIDLLDFETRELFWKVYEEKQASSLKLQKIQLHLEWIFSMMRRYDILRTHHRGRSAEECGIDSICLQKAKEVWTTAKALLKEGTTSVPLNLLARYFILGQMLENVLTLDRWPWLFFKSPMALEKENPQLEEKYHFALFQVLRRSVLNMPFDSIQRMIHELEKPLQGTEKGLVQSALRAVQKCKEEFEIIQKRINLRPVTSANFKEEAQLLWQDVTEFLESQEEILEPLELAFHEYLERVSQKNEAITSAQAHLNDFRELFQHGFLAPFQPLARYLIRDELIRVEADEAQQRMAEKAAREVKPISRRVLKRPVAIEKPQQAIVKILQEITPAVVFPIVSGSLRDALFAFSAICGDLEHYCQNFESTTQSPEHLLRGALQKKCSTHLIECLPILQELVGAVDTCGDLPFMSATIHLRLAVGFEQASKLALACVNMKAPTQKEGHILLEKMGRECFWQQHAPFPLTVPLELDYLKREKKRIFNDEQRELVKSVEPVIAITYRYPSGRDALSQGVKKCLSIKSEADRQNVRQNLENRLRIGIDACVALVRFALPPTVKKVEKPVLFTNKIDLALSTDPLAKPAEWGEFQPLERRIRRLKKYQTLLDKQLVIPLHKDDLSCGRRQGSISCMLRDLDIAVKMSRVLMDVEEPSLCLTLCEESLMRRAVVLERLLLLFLSYYPCPSDRSIFEHFLWCQKDGRPKRYSHDLKDFVRKLLQHQPHLFPEATRNELEKQANELTEYLKQEFRYYPASAAADHPLRSKLKTLSIVRDRVVRNALTEGEAKLLDQALKIAHPDERLEKLDAHIIHILNREVKSPLIRMLKKADELLKVYEKNLNR